jgi:pimeloyl-ACP methyl ester carboxylesterase
MNAVRLGLRVLDAASPAAAGAVAERLFFSPPRPRFNSNHEAFLATGRPLDLRVEGRRVAAWAWGEGPAIALVHGWGSRGVRWRSHVEPLTSAGYTAVTFDAPGHGHSEGRMSSMPEFARTLLALGEKVGGLHGLVAHSMGGAATVLAMSYGLKANRAVFIAPASDPAGYAEGFRRIFRLGNETIVAMKLRSEKRLRFRWDDLHVPTMARAMSAPLLVIHDEEDRTVPLAEGRAIAESWPGAELVVTKGLGHHDVVRDPEVLKRTTAFITQR